jgi:PAS domain S-box-containing protein
MTLDLKLTRMNAFLQLVPKKYMVMVLGCIDFMLLYLDVLTGPRISLTIFYMLLVFLALKYAGSRFAYFFVFVSAVGKTYVKSQFYPQQVSLLLDLWQFITVYSLYSMFCYLLDAQMSQRRQAEVALDDLSQLHQSIIAGSDSGVMVFKADGECILANEAAAAIVGCSMQTILKCNFREIGVWKSSGMLRAAEVVLDTGAMQKINAPLVTSFGRDIWCIASLVRIDRKLSEPYLLAIFADMSAYKEAERKIISISEETQQRVGQELHDDLGQHLTGIAFMSEVLFQRLKHQGHVHERDAATITSLINEAISKTRKLAQGLYPVEMKENGLRGMLEHLAGNVVSIHQKQCQVICSDECNITDAHVVINLFRIAQEAVNNAIRHSGASKITLTVTSTSAHMTLEVEDNGCGISAMGSVPGGLGMHTMRYRASMLGGTLDMMRIAQGGTRVSVSLPSLMESSHAKY